MTGYEARTAAKKAAILDAARKLFCERGMQAVSIGEIAKTANVSQVSIYNYFGDKNALAREAFMALINNAMVEYENIISSDIPFAEKVRTILQSKNDIAAQIASACFNKQALDDKQLLQVFQDTVVEKAKTLYHCFAEQGKAEGVIDKEIPNEAIVSFFLLSVSLFRQIEFLAAPVEYKTGMMKLFLYGVIGNAENSTISGEI